MKIEGKFKSLYGTAGQKNFLSLFFGKTAKEDSKCFLSTMNLIELIFAIPINAAAYEQKFSLIYHIHI